MHLKSYAIDGQLLRSGFADVSAGYHSHPEREARRMRHGSWGRSIARHVGRSGRKSFSGSIRLNL